jgi:acetyltransferase-like isoleucine patch superfamily enzyme
MNRIDISHLYKIVWGFRALLYKFLFGKLEAPSYIGKPTFLFQPHRAYISERTRIFPGLRMEVHGDGEIYIHRNVSIGQNLHITCQGKLEINSGTLISGNVMITDIDHGYMDIQTSLFDQPFLVKKTTIGKNCFIGYGACIQAGTTLGNHCVVGANAVVRGDFPDYSVIVGAPAKVVKKYNQNLKVWERA